MAKQESMNLIEFQKKFQTEEACHEHLYKMKWPQGYCCPKCKHDKAYEIKTRKLPLYECVNCEHQTTVIAGTIFEKTRTDLLKWFWAILLIAQDKRGVSATYLSEELGIAYQTAWTIQHKIRKAMGERDTTYTLAGIVELDEGLPEAVTNPWRSRRDGPDRRDRRRLRQAPVPQDTANLSEPNGLSCVELDEAHLVRSGQTRDGDPRREPTSSGDANSDSVARVDADAYRCVGLGGDDVSLQPPSVALEHFDSDSTYGSHIVGDAITDSRRSRDAPQPETKVNLASNGGNRGSDQAERRLCDEVPTCDPVIVLDECPVLEKRDVGPRNRPEVSLTGNRENGRQPRVPEDCLPDPIPDRVVRIQKRGVRNQTIDPVRRGCPEKYPAIGGGSVDDDDLGEDRNGR